MFLRFTHWDKQLLFPGLNWLQAPSYLPGWVGGRMRGRLDILRLKVTHPQNFGWGLWLFLSIIETLGETKNLCMSPHYKNSTTCINKNISNPVESALFRLARQILSWCTGSCALNRFTHGEQRFSWRKGKIWKFKKEWIE